MRQTVSNMLGSLPPQYFEVTVTTVGENLAQLMFSPPTDSALPLGPVQKTHVAGEVLRWDAEAERVVRVLAVDYVELLEGEVRALKRRLEEEEAKLARVGGGGGGSGNALLEYLKGLEPQNIQELTASADDDALAAMNAFIQRLLGVPDVEEIKSVASETTVTELAKLLYWLMVVGYSLRTLEVRFDMDRALAAPAVQKRAELPPPGTDGWII
ncbi:unnamed protein product [Closterium sp. Yama58-4]|nr:unnamed protein product [Closterium sp. Yama58-4]